MGSPTSSNMQSSKKLWSIQPNHVDSAFCFFYNNFFDNLFKHFSNITPTQNPLVLGKKMDVFFKFSFVCFDFFYGFFSFVYETDSRSSLTELLWLIIYIYTRTELELFVRGVKINIIRYNIYFNLLYMSCKTKPI